jgi:hypothetical protein
MHSAAVPAALMDRPLAVIAVAACRASDYRAADASIAGAAAVFVEAAEVRVAVEAVSAAVAEAADGAAAAAEAGGGSGASDERRET